MRGMLPHSTTLCERFYNVCYSPQCNRQFISTKQASCNARWSLTTGTKGPDLWQKMPTFLPNNRPTNHRLSRVSSPPLSLSELLNSQRLQEAICGLGAWSALARAFNAYNNNLDKPVNRRDEKQGQLPD
jgi:hypothetical protein